MNNPVRNVFLEVNRMENKTPYGNYILFENNAIKKVRSPDYNYDFDKNSGFFARWGKMTKDDPDFSKFGPEIADIEITTVCSGPSGKPCSFCYKANTPRGTHMSLDTFKKVLAKLPNTLTQIAFGSDATATENPDLLDIMRHCRSKGIVPNITVANISDETAGHLANLCGAVAVSRYHNKDWCYDSIERLSKHGMKQINIHQLISQQTMEQARETIRDAKTDPRLAGLKAIVFLSLKKKGRGKGYDPISQDEFTELVNYAFNSGVNIGFDSCSANKFVNAINGHKNYHQYLSSTEPCESTLFSLYIDVNGLYYPCSFSEEMDIDQAGDWSQGLDVANCEDFLRDIWYHKRTNTFRNRLLTNTDKNNIRSCPIYEI